MNFQELHQQSSPLLLANVWDVASTQIAEQLNFQALGTSSAAIAKSLGYADGEDLSFDELEFIVKRIAKNTKLPLSVDLESGYSRVPQEIVKHIKRLVDLGVVGVNIEDSIVEKDRQFLEPEAFAQAMATVKNQLEKDKIPIFLNLRTDTYLLGHPEPLTETLKRIQLYENAGADGIFIPGLVEEKDIKKIVNYTSLPINLMCMPQLPDFEKLQSLGVKRISMGNFLFETMHQNFEKMLQEIVDQKSFKSIF